MSDVAQADGGVASIKTESPTASAGSGELVLSSKQEQALEAINKGYSLKVAADEAGVSRMTLYRWIRSHAAFRAAYNAWEQEARETARARLLSAAESAVEKVIAGLHIDYKFAFQVIKELGLHRAGPSLEIDPYRTARQMDVEVKELDRRLVERAARITQTIDRQGSGGKPIALKCPDRSTQQAAEELVRRIVEERYTVEDVTLPGENEDHS